MGPRAAAWPGQPRRLVLVVLDTTVLIDYMRETPLADRVDALEPRRDTAATTAVNVEELARGMRDDEIDRAAGLVDGLVVLPIIREVAWLAGTWRRDHAAMGVTLSQPDCLIAAATYLVDGLLATANVRHFPMEGLRVERWSADD